jgi:hypothetical protein
VEVSLRTCELTWLPRDDVGLLRSEGKREHELEDGFGASGWMGVRFESGRTLVLESSQGPEEQTRGERSGRGKGMLKAERLICKIYQRQTDG